MIRLSSSFELDAWANVSPVRLVSATSGSEVETPLTVDPATLPVCVWRRMNVKLKMRSSSLERRSKNVGTGADEGTSGSCIVDQRLARQHHHAIPSICTWIYSIGVSSFESRFAIYRTAGNAFGDRVSRRRRELLIVTDAIETGGNIVSVWRVFRKEESS